MQNMHENMPERVTTETISPEHLKRLLEISARLSSTLQLDELLALVMEVATELTHTETASILLVDRDTGQLHFAASTDNVVPENIEVPLDNSIAGWVVRHGRSLILGDVQGDTRFYNNVDKNLEFVTRSMLAVPLTTSQGVIGALEVLNKEGNLPYTGQDVALMESLASQSAVAILNAHLFNQSDLLAEIMHEIKTPLMAITSASELMTRPDFPVDKHGELIGMINRESKRLSKMTRDFLDFARLESRRIRLARLPVDVRTVIMDVVHISESQATERGIAIEADLPAHLPDSDSEWRLIGDSDRLKQIVLNLVSNAVKYNVDNGRVTILAKVTDNEVVLDVADTGNGIEPQDMEHLFERFYRIPGSEGQEGTGLGLSVAKKLVEEHNGRIEVSSTIGVGTTFTISLPLTNEPE
ncbi:MAG: GAF domain-containing sensor histidine kinase [Anaerolineales bacterium]|nr:GAF domain-containing sensor histidine kinase [Anaerolineales bacterium]MCA9929832.1 GAF domain-containing sensor histidine kinase [Anaerolineales bacterium]